MLSSVACIASREPALTGRFRGSMYIGDLRFKELDDTCGYSISSWSTLLGDITARIGTFRPDGYEENSLRQVP